MSNSKGKYRAPVYDYLRSRGFEMTIEDHEALREILIKYVEAETESLNSFKKIWLEHEKKCQLFLARKQARADRKKQLMKNKPNA